MSGCCWTGCGPVAAASKLRQIPGTTLAASDFHQGSDDASDRAAQKAPSDDGDGNQAAGCHRTCLDRPHAVAGRWPGREGALVEVLVAGEQGCGLGHRTDLERLRLVPGERSEKRRCNLPEVEVVGVGLTQGIVAGVK